MNFDNQKYKTYTWKHPWMLHWILNPGIAVNELLFGLRVPKLILMERDKNKKFAERNFVPCPHCHTIHSGLKWSNQNKTTFGNWFGFYCDSCGGIIPCLRNLTSWIIIVLTFPIWIWFVKGWKQKWLESQRERFAKPFNLNALDYDYLKGGLNVGVSIFTVNFLILPIFEHEKIHLLKILLGLLFSGLGGFIYCIVLKRMFGSKLPVSKS